MPTESNQQIILGGGCFWCLEAAYQLIEGIIEVIPGYAGGEADNPSYEEVCTGQTGHTEVVKVTFNPSIIELADVLDVFWSIHDPTTLNRQGNDKGTQYRSAIYYNDAVQASVISKSVKAISLLWHDPIVTEVAKLDKFYPAEEYHRNYFQSHPEAAYCQVIINPKLQKLRKKFAARLKV